VKVVGTVLAAVVALSSSARLHSAAAEDKHLKDGPGRDLTVGRCNICHSVEYIPANAVAQNRTGWQKTIQKMRERFGAPITDDEAREILDYLDANYSGKKD
jgi:hypothetical protein